MDTCSRNSDSTRVNRFRQLIDAPNPTATIVKISLSGSSTDNNSELSGNFNDDKNNRDESTTENFNKLMQHHDGNLRSEVNDNYNFICPSHVPSVMIHPTSVVYAKYNIKKESLNDD